MVHNCNCSREFHFYHYELVSHDVCFSTCLKKGTTTSQDSSFICEEHLISRMFCKSEYSLLSLSGIVVTGVWCFIHVWVSSGGNGAGCGEEGDICVPPRNTFRQGQNCTSQHKLTYLNLHSLFKLVLYC